MVPEISEHEEPPHENAAFLTEFNIKTKSLKPHVKARIDDAIREVKLQLIEQFHVNRTNKFREINTEQHIDLVKSKKSRGKPSNIGITRCETTSSLNKDNDRELNKWTRATGRSTQSTRVSTAQGPRKVRYYKLNTPLPPE